MQWHFLFVSRSFCSKNKGESALQKQLLCAALKFVMNKRGKVNNDLVEYLKLNISSTSAQQCKFISQQKMHKMKSNTLKTSSNLI